MKRLLASSTAVAGAVAGAAAAAAAQTGTIRGTVTDQTGTPVPGVQVVVAGTRVGAVTDDAGRYRIVGARAGVDTLRASRIGYLPTTQVVTGAGDVVADLRLTHAAAQLSSVVVTGVFDARTAREASVAISTLDTTAIRMTPAVSSADLLKKVPGVFVNSALGEIRNIVYSRGVSAGSVEAATGYFYVSMQEDGLPVTSITGSNYGPDYFFRADATTGRVEAVRGGSASITSANAPGGIFNYRSQTGGTEGSGEIRSRTGSQNGHAYQRFDLNYGGPLGSSSGNWTYDAGGFYRYDRGVRDAGFPMNVGGQLKANATRELAGGGYLRIYGKYLNDRNGWFEFIPVTNFADPTYLPGFGPDASVLMPKSQVTVHSDIRGKDITIDPSRLVHSQDRAVGASFSRELKSLGGIQVDNDVRYSNKYRNWNSSAVVFTSSLTDILPYAFNGVVASPGIYTFTNTATGQQVATVNRMNPFGPSVTSSTLGSGNNTISSLALHIEDYVSEVMDQLRLSKKVGNQRFTLGGFFSNAGVRNYGDIGGFGQMTFQSRPQMLAVSYTDPAGKTYQITDKNGFGSSRGDNEAQATWRNVSAFFGHSWQITPKLNFDWGARAEFVTAKGTNTRDSVTQTNGPDGNPLTLFDNTTHLLYNKYSYDETMRTTSVSGGVNYLLSKDVAVYVRGSHGQKTPDLNYFFGITSPFLAANVSPVNQKIDQYEGGVKFQRGTFSAVATPFYSYLHDIFTQQALQNTDGTFYNGPVVYNSIKTVGLELETHGTLSNGLGLGTAMTFQNAKAVTWKLVDAGSPGPTDDKIVDYSGGEAENNAKVMLNVTPSYARGPFATFVTWHYLGKRPANVPHAFDLPAFSQLDAGVDVTVLGKTRVGLAVNNLTNSNGIMSWTPPGLLVSRGYYSPAQVQANPNAVFGVVPIQPRSVYLTLGRTF
jgi:outer membrane receptor protein involved in Fe transport